MDLDIAHQRELVEDYESLVLWMDRGFQHGITGDPKLRFREEIIENITNYTDTISAEKEVLAALTQSQCTNTECNLIFNTSDASLRSALNAAGVITTTPDGTEVALWAFDSIDIDEHVNVTLTGQRAMALVSRSWTRINTALHDIPGTLGGFPGGFSVARRPNKRRLVRVCNEEVESREFLDMCKGSVHRAFTSGVHNPLQALVLDRVKYQLGYPEAAKDMLRPKSVLTAVEQYSMGNERSLEDYLKMVGLNMTSKEVTITHWCETGNVPPGSEHLADFYSKKVDEARRKA